MDQLVNFHYGHRSFLNMHSAFSLKAFDQESARRGFTKDLLPKGRQELLIDIDMSLAGAWLSLPMVIYCLSDAQHKCQQHFSLHDKKYRDQTQRPTFHCLSDGIFTHTLLGTAVHSLGQIIA